jgi:hypothetical protein
MENLQPAIIHLKKLFACAVGLDMMNTTKTYWPGDGLVSCCKLNPILLKF